MKEIALLLVYLGNSNLKIAISFHFYINFKNFYFLPSLLLFPSTFFKIAISFQFDFDFSVMTEIALNFHRNSPNRQSISGLKIKRIEKNMNVLIAFSRKVSSFWKILLSNVTLLLKNLEWPLSQDSRVSVACKSVWLFFYLLPAKIFHHTNIWLSYVLLEIKVLSIFNVCGMSELHWLCVSNSGRVPRRAS